MLRAIQEGKKIKMWKKREENIAEDEIKEEFSGEGRIMKKPEFIETYSEGEWYRAKWPLRVFDKKWNGWVRVRSTGFRDTPKSLYRFLYIWEPKEIDFSDMYKSTLALIDLDGKAMIALDLFKYELAAYLYVPPSDVMPKEELEYEIEISCGIPGVDEEELVETSKATELFREFISLLEREHDVYPGNYFKV